MTTAYTPALVRALLRRSQDPLVPAVTMINGYPRAGARLEIVAWDSAAKAYTWTEAHIGFRTKSGSLDLGGYPIKHQEYMDRFGGFVRTVGRRQVLRTSLNLLPWQEGNLVYAGKRLDDGKYGDVGDLNLNWGVSMAETDVRRRGPRGTVTDKWLPRLLDARDRRGKIVPKSDLAHAAEKVGLTLNATDVEVVEACGGNIEKMFLPSSLCQEIVPAAMLINLSAYENWTPVTLDSLAANGLWMPIADFTAREQEFLARREAAKQQRVLRDARPVTPDVNVEEILATAEDIISGAEEAQEQSISPEVSEETHQEISPAMEAAQA